MKKKIYKIGKEKIASHKNLVVGDKWFHFWIDTMNDKTGFSLVDIVDFSDLTAAHNFIHVRDVKTGQLGIIDVYSLSEAIETKWTKKQK